MRLIQHLAALALAAIVAPIALAGGPSVRPGIGAIPYVEETEYGTTFRVWAPNADSVHVAGTFNGWADALDELFSEGNGFWSLDRGFVAAGHQYKYVIRNGTDTLWRNDAQARWLVNSIGNSIILDPNQYPFATKGYSTPAWNDVVIYEMHLGTFYVPDGTPPAVFDDATAKLDYLADLGVNMIEIMPINEFPGDFSWGYNPSHPYSVESAYGGPNEFKQFIDDAHARGIGVIVDTVHNHYGPTDLDLWQYDGWSLGPGLGGIFFFNDDRAITPWGDTRPDYTVAEVRSYVRDNMLMWLEEFHADGLRVDGVQYIRTESPGGPDLAGGWSLLQWINDEIDATQPWKLIIAEDLAENPSITRPTGEGGAGFNAQASSFFAPVREALITTWDADRNMNDVASAITAIFNGSFTQRVIYTENHDEVANGSSRVPEEISPSDPGSWFARKRSTLGAVLVLASPGIPMIFQGQELLEDEFFTDTDPVDWTKRDTYDGIHQLYQDLIHLRRDFEGATTGLKGPNTNVHHVNDSNKMIAFHRWDQGGVGDDVVVMTNFANIQWPAYRIGLPQPGTWHVVFNSDSTAYSDDYGDYGSVAVDTQSIPYDGMPFSAELSIAAYSSLILSQQPLAGEPPSPDLDDDGVVGFSDVVALLAMWGQPGAADLDEDGTVGFADLVIMLAAWGPLP